jgi:hypothetical protein
MVSSLNETSLYATYITTIKPMQRAVNRHKYFKRSGKEGKRSYLGNITSYFSDTWFYKSCKFIALLSFYIASSIVPGIELGG